MTNSINSSITGSLMPMMLRLPLKSAARLDQVLRCSLPGDSDWPNEPTIMSKSKSLTRFSYWAGSTRRARALIPSRLRLRTNGRTTRSNAGLLRRISKRICLPVLALTSFLFLTTHPACFRIRIAERRPARIFPEPS